MFFCRYLIFDLQESSKYLVASGRDEEAIEALRYIAKRNGTTMSLTLEQLNAIDESGRNPQRKKISVWQTILKSFDSFSLLVFLLIFICVMYQY